MLNNEERYHFHNEVFNIRDRLRYLKIFGALLANSIANKQIIGVEFTTPMVKVLYGEEIQFSDLQDLMDTKSYECMRSYTDVEFEYSYLDFTILFNKQTHELIPGGADVQVRRSNLELYLNSVAQFEIRNKFEPLFTAFK